MKILLLIYFYLIAYSCSLQKTFDKKFVTQNSFELAEVKQLHYSSEQMNKITCSSLCLRDSKENCNAFRINAKNECELIKNPEDLQEQHPQCLENDKLFIWTAKDLKPPTPASIEFVMVVGGLNEPYTEIIKLGCPTFQCKNMALPTLRPTYLAVGGIINQTPIVCGGQAPGGGKYDKCFKFQDLRKNNDSYSTLLTYVYGFLFRMERDFWYTFHSNSSFW